MYSIKTGRRPVAIVDIYLVSTEDICPVPAADICPVSTEDIYPVSTEDVLGGDKNDFDLNRGGSYETGADGADCWPWGPDETLSVRGHAVESRQVTTCPELRW